MNLVIQDAPEKMWTLKQRSGLEQSPGSHCLLALASVADACMFFLQRMGNFLRGNVGCVTARCHVLWHQHVMSS